MKKFTAFAIAILLSVGAFAQNGGNQPQAKVNNFSLKSSGDKTVSLNNFANSKAVVLVFTTTSCAYDRMYENRLVKLANSYANQGVQFIFINPAVGSGDGSETLADMAAKKYSFPYLADEGQKVSAQFGATKTPEVFVLQNSNGGFAVKYKGAIDDNPQLESEVKENYLKNALDAVVSNKAVTTADRRAKGCLIKRY